jgi:hypothetical protein
MDATPVSVQVLTSPQTRPALLGPRLLRATEHIVDRNGVLLAVMLVLLFSLWAWFASRETRLSMEELLELSVATAPTTGQIPSFLRAGIDYNPPLSHILTRFSVTAFGVSEWSIRLPAFLGTIGCLVFLYRFVSLWLTPSYGIFAMLVVMCSPVREFGVLGRPYGLVLGFSGVALLAYQRAIARRPRLLALLTLSLTSAAVSASHYYGVLGMAGILLAEGVRAKRLGRPDWRLVLCVVVPPILVFAVLLNVIREQRSQLIHYFARGNLLSFDHGYDSFDIDPMIYCVGLVLIVVACWQPQMRSMESITFPPDPASPESCAGLGLLLLPILGAFLTQFVTHAYVPRYFLPAVLGLAICLCYVTKLFSSMLPGAVMLLNLVLAIGFCKATMQDGLRPVQTLAARGTLTAATGPILFDSPSAYMQILHYYPELHSKLWVIADPPTQLRYRKYDTDDKIMLALASKGLAQTTTLRGAVRRWPEFSLIPRSADSVWALKCLIGAGADIAVHHPFGDSNFIFEARALPETFPYIDACSSMGSVSYPATR